ncbi:hypothetical protein LTR70_008765 [Exophiala xenobiotica]|nr:hypothetical protein LTR70_008765 [Exophiala xenobiotica]
MQRHRPSFSSAGRPRRISVPIKTKKQKSQIVEDQEADEDVEEADSDGEESGSDGEIVGDHLELIAELGYKVVHLDEFGRAVTQRHWISLDDAEVKRVQFLREDDDDGTLHRLATEGLDVAIVGEQVSRAPADEDLRPAFVALFDYTSELQEQCSEQKAKLTQLKEAVRVFQSIGPTTPEWVKDQEFATQYDLQRKLNKQEKEIARLQERFNKQIRSGQIELDPVQNAPEQNEPKRDSVTSALQGNIRTHRDDNEDLRTQLQIPKTAIATTDNESGLMDWLNEPAHTQVDLEEKQLKGNNLQRQAGEKDKRLNMSVEHVDEYSRERLVDVEMENLELKQERDTLREMCTQSLRRLQQIAEWQSGQQKAQQVHFEWDRVKGSTPAQQSELPSKTDVATETTLGTEHNTMVDLKRLRWNAVSSAERSQDPAYTTQDPKSVDTGNVIASPRKKKPSPIHTPPVPISGLPEASRSPKELEGIPSTQLGRFQKQQLLNEYLEAAQSQEMFQTRASARAMWDDYAKDPIQFTSRAKLVCDVGGQDRSLAVKYFVHGDKVFVFVDSMKDWWPVKCSQGEYLLHRTALTLICPHDQEYNDPFLVIADADLVSDGGESLHPLVRGQIVQCAHSAIIKSSTEDADVLLRCVQSQDGNATGWAPAQVLQELDYACGAGSSKSSSEQCPCERSQPYTWRAIVREDCSAIDGSFSLKIDDYVDLAHAGSPSSKGLLCIRDRSTGLRGYVRGVHLRVLRQPLVEDLANGQELVVELTPTFFPVQSENWIAGEEVPFEVAKSQEPSRGWFSRSTLPFSQEAKQAWENNVQGTNPHRLKWADAEARARPIKVMDDLYNEYFDHGRYITLADDLTAGLGGDLPRNPFGPDKGKRRARSLSAFEQRQKWNLKYGPHIGYQPAKTSLGDGKLSGRDYDSEPVSDEARSKVDRTLSYKKVNGKMRVVEARDELDVHDLDLWQTNGGKIAKYSDFPEGSDKPVTARYKGGSRYARGPDFVQRANEMRQLSLSQQMSQYASEYSADAESKTPTSWSISIDVNDVAISEIEKDRRCGYRLAYGLSRRCGELGEPDAMCTADDRFELYLAGDEPLRETLVDDNNKFAIRQIVIEEDSDNGPVVPKILRISPVDLDWSQPYLRCGVDTETGAEVILLLWHRDKDTWDCFSEDDILEIPASEMRLLPTRQWPTFASVCKAITEVEKRLARNGSVSSGPASTFAHSFTNSQSAKDVDWPVVNEPHPVFQKGEWDVLFPVREAQSSEDPRIVQVDTDDHVYLRAGYDDDYHVCEVYSTGLHGFIPRRAVDEKEASLPLCVARYDLGMSSNWVIVLKRKSNMLFCGLPDKSKGWFYEEELSLDDHQGQIVTLHRLLLEDMLQVDDLKPVGAARAKNMLREGATAQMGALDEHAMPEIRPSSNNTAARGIPSMSQRKPRLSDIEHQTLSDPQLEVQAYPTSPISEDGSLASDSQNKSEPATRSRYIPATPKEGLESWGFHHPAGAADATDHTKASSEEPTETGNTDQGSKRVHDEHKDLAATGDDANDDNGRLVVPYEDYREVKDANKTRANTDENAAGSESTSRPVGLGITSKNDTVKTSGESPSVKAGMQAAATQARVLQTEASSLLSEDDSSAHNETETAHFEARGAAKPAAQIRSIVSPHLRRTSDQATQAHSSSGSSSSISFTAPTPDSFNGPSPSSSISFMSSPVVPSNKPSPRPRQSPPQPARSPACKSVSVSVSSDSPPMPSREESRPNAPGSSSLSDVSTLISYEPPPTPPCKEFTTTTLVSISISPNPTDATSIRRRIPFQLRFDKSTLAQIVYFGVLIYLFLGVYSARNEWLGANGLNRGVSLVRGERESYVGGGWEWGPWEALKGLLEEMMLE